MRSPVQSWVPLHGQQGTDGFHLYLYCFCPLLFHCNRKAAETTSDTGKTTSYIEKIMSDIIQTTSDIIFRPCNLLENIYLQKIFASLQIFGNQCVMQNLPNVGNPVPFRRFAGAYFKFPDSIRYSPICTALSAAPLRIWSPESQNVSPLGFARSLRKRPT